MKLNYFVWMLLAMQCIFSVTMTGNAPSPTCCTKTSKTNVNVIKIAKYEHQDTPLCRIKAVRFYLRNSNKIICSNPEDTWTKHAINKLDQRTTPSLTSTSGTKTITSRSSPQPSTESTITMTTPKGSSTTWKLGTFITHVSSPKQTSGNTNKPSQTTTTPITPIKMPPSTATTTITTEGKPSTTNIETTSTSMTTENPVTMTATTLRPRTTVTHRTTEQSTKAQITTFSVTATTMKRKPLTTESQMTTSMSTRTETTWNPTSSTFKQVTPETKTSSMTTGTIMTMTSPRGTSTSESPVQKSSTRNSKPQTTSCRTTMSSTTTKKKNIPWTVRRLRKKSKTGLRRAQMNIKTKMC